MAGDRPLVVDRDTVGLAVPERDLWLVASDPADLDRYTDSSGHRPDPGALASYRLRWDLRDLGECVDRFSAPHGSGPNTESAWRGLVEVVDRLAA